MEPRAAPHLSDSNDPGKTDWVMRNPVLFFSIFGSVMLALILFCAYCLWRGPMRAFLPCIKKRPKPITTHRETGDDLKDPNGILSPDRAPGPNLAFWRSSRAASSGDWGQQVYLTDLKRQAEADADVKGEGSVKFDEEAVRYAQGGSGSPESRPMPRSSGQRKSRGIGMSNSPMIASPLGGRVSPNRNSSPMSSTLSHSRLIKSQNRQTSPAPISALSSTPSSALVHTRPRAMSPASTILPNPALPPRHPSLYSPMSTPLYPKHAGLPSGSSSTLSPIPSTAPYMSPSMRYSSAGVNVPPMARIAYSPFTPRQSVNVTIEEDQAGQRGSIRSERGYAV